MINILCVMDYFLPGFKAGGPIRTLQNMAKITDGAAKFHFLTRDHDLGSLDRYEGISPNQWASYSQGEVFYATGGKFGLPALSRALATRDVDIIYLNSFFSFRGAIAIVMRNRVRPFGIPILLAPRGEFSPGALALKSARKRLFLAMGRLLGLYRDVWWHASSEEEKNDILRQFPNARPRIFTAEDPVDMADEAIPGSTKKVAGVARLVFVSRISPMKNLDALLAILRGVTCRSTLQIYGPIEDQEYWQRCKAMIADLPPHVSAQYCGELKPEDVSRAFSEGDLFAFPTRGENFGHVIFEALRAGTPVLVSDQTPWRPDETAALIRLPLDAIDDWRANIEAVAQLTDVAQQERRADSLRYARRHSASENTRMDNLRMLEEAARHKAMKVSE